MDAWAILTDRTGTVHPRAASLVSAIADPRRTVVVGGRSARTARGPARLRRPADRGTGPDALLALLHIMANDAAVQVVLVPGDFMAGPEVSVFDAVTAALDDERSDGVHLIGAERGRCRPGAPWLLPVARGDGGWPSVRSVLDPRVDPGSASASGGLLYTGVVVGSAWALATLIRAARPTWFWALARGVRRAEEVEVAYARLEAFDTFDDVLLPAIAALRVVPALPWNRVEDGDGPARALPARPLSAPPRDGAGISECAAR